MTDQPRRAQPAQMKPYLAHVRRKDDGSFVLHELEEHLQTAGGIAQCVIARPDPRPGTSPSGADARRISNAAQFLKARVHEEVIAAGAIIIRTVMEMLAKDECLVSDLGLREGVLIDLVLQGR